MSLAVHCDRNGCDKWAVDDEGDPPTGWLSVTTVDEDDEATQQHFCSRDCLLFHFAGFEVPNTAE